MAFLGISLLIVLWLVWNITLVGYRDSATVSITPNVDDVFDARCLPIILEHDEVVEGAIIMVHGFPSTPYTYEGASRIAHEAGYDVFVPLLPGFGTDVKDLAHTTYAQWYGYLREYYLEKRNHYPRLYVIGTSMGGAMTLDLAQEFSQTDYAPDAVVTIAAPIYLNNMREGFIMSPLSYFARTFALFMTTLSASVFHGKEEPNDGDENWIGYKGQFPRAGLSFLGALKRIRRSLGNITVPILSIHDTQDETIHFRNQELILSKVASARKERITTSMEATHTRHILLMYPSVREELMRQILAFLHNTSTLSNSRQESKE